jgi:hypothetical protein
MAQGVTPNPEVARFCLACTRPAVESMLPDLTESLGLSSVDLMQNPGLASLCVLCWD